MSCKTHKKVTQLIVLSMVITNFKYFYIYYPLSKSLMDGHKVEEQRSGTPLTPIPNS